MAFRITHGHYPRLLCLHSCDNPSCVNPAHLRDGSQKENVRECTDKGRRASPARGEKHPMSKLTEETAREVFALKGKVSRGKVALRFGLAKSTVTRIFSGKIWRHVTGDAVVR